MTHLPEEVSAQVWA